MRQFCSLFIAVWVCVGSACTAARADGGAVRLVEEQGGHRISVFTSPNPLRAGPVDVSVLVQDAESDQPVSTATVRVTLAPRGQSNRSIRALATADAATNKLLRAAVFDLPEPGWWDVEIECDTPRGPAQVHFDMEAGPAAPRWFAVWPWFCWPAGAVAIFALHRWLVARKDAVITKRRPRASVAG